MVESLRFAVGDRVRCKVSATQWKRGTVVRVHYREQGWPAGRVAPYQVELIDGALIFAPQDDDRLVRADDGGEETKEIHVCLAGSCRRAGGEAVLLEIEELARDDGSVEVASSGCLGNCSNAPNALLVSDGCEQIFARLCTLSATADLVERASGRAPDLDDAAMVTRLQGARRLRARMEAREESKWNLALAGLAEDVARAQDDEHRAELVQEYAELLASAGQADRALEALSSAASEEDLSLGDIPALRLLLDKARLLARMGRAADLERLQSLVDWLQPRTPRETSIKSQVVDMLSGMSVGVPTDLSSAGQPASLRVEGYALWRLESVTPVTGHSAVFRFASGDASRGTPIRKGRGGRTVWHRTWHSTLLAFVGEPHNKEGPLPWIERDYTPISTAHDWVQGRCDILIKVYLQPRGLATEWLHRVSSAVKGLVGGSGGGGEAGPTVWLSRPMKTLHVPSLALDERHINRKHASILLLVAGTGVVAVPQVLHHASAESCFGPRPPVTQPVSVLYSCRSDDALLIPEIAGWCRQGALARATVLLTAPQAASRVAAPFPDGPPDVEVAAAFAGLDNAACLKGRLCPERLRAELSRLQRPLRVVVSGPAGFNGACKSMLREAGGDLGAEAVTVLSA